MDNPVLVIASRGHYPESQHRGAIAVVNSSGKIILSEGDIQKPIFPRSAAKLFQTIPLIESGAAEAYHLSAHEIAMACGSHNGDDIHIRTGDQWLKKINKSEDILHCGVHRPMGREASKKLMRLGQKPTILQNACTGKHLSFITTALHRGEDSAEYTSRMHPVQKRVEQAIEEMTDFDTAPAPHAIDGCEVPVIGVPLYNIALGMARFADPSGLNYTRQKAISTIIESLKAHPEMIGGEGTFDTRLIQLTHGKVIAKMGASGTYVAFAPDQALGIALKIDDGNIKASEIALIHVLEELGLIDIDTAEKLGREQEIFTYNKRAVGKIHSVPKKKVFLKDAASE